MHENELIQALREGSESAFGELVRAYGSRIYNTALSLVQNAEDAEEIAQDVFVKVYRHIANFRNESGLSTWLYRITVTQSLDLLRKKKRQRTAAQLFGLFGKAKDEEIPHFDHPGVLAEQKENASILFRAIRSLPAQQQAAFVLQKTEGLSQQEIAHILDTTASAVESLLHRAKANLRKYLENFYKNQDA